MKRSIEDDIDNISYSSSDNEIESEDELIFNHKKQSNPIESKNKQDDIINVEFCFFDPNIEHFHSVRQHLNNFLGIKDLDISGLADIIVKQAASGTMICVENENDVYGFITALNLERYKNEKSIQQIKNAMIQKCLNQSNKVLLQEMLNDTKNKIGLVINQRLINLPYQLVPPLHSSFHQDISWAIKNEITEELKDSFNFDYFLVICPLSNNTNPSGKTKNNKKERKTESDSCRFYNNFEDEFLEQASKLWYHYSKNGQNYIIMIISREKHKETLKDLNNMLVL